MTTLKQAAALADGRRRDCMKCDYHPCNPTLMKFCTDTYVKGFLKGAQFKQKQQHGKETGH